MNPLLIVNKLNKSEEEIRTLPRKYSVRCVLFTEDDKVALVSSKYENEDLERYYSFAGGKIEDGENPDEACKREIREETGFISENVEPLGVIFTVRNEHTSVCYGFVARVHRESRQKIELTEEEKDENLLVETFSYEEAILLFGRQHTQTNLGLSLRELTFLLEAKRIITSKEKV